MITDASRYQNSRVEKVSTPRGDVAMIVPSPQGGWAFDYTDHLVGEGERVDILATVYYGDGRLWWRIADANPEIMDWTEIIPGTVLRIPSV